MVGGVDYVLRERVSEDAVTSDRAGDFGFSEAAGTEKGDENQG